MQDTDLISIPEKVQGVFHIPQGVCDMAVCERSHQLYSIQMTKVKFANYMFYYHLKLLL